MRATCVLLSRETEEEPEWLQGKQANSTRVCVRACVRARVCDVCARV